MIGDEDGNKGSWIMEMMKSIGKIVKAIAKRVWDYTEHY